MTQVHYEKLTQLSAEAAAYLRRANDFASKSAATGLSQVEYTEAVDLDEALRKFRVFILRYQESSGQIPQEQATIDNLWAIYNSTLCYLDFAFREANKGLYPERN